MLIPNETKYLLEKSLKCYKILRNVFVVCILAIRLDENRNQVKKLTQNVFGGKSTSLYV